MNATDLLGALMGAGGMRGTSHQRVDNALRNSGGSGGVLGEILGGAAGQSNHATGGSGDLMDTLGRMAGSMFGQGGQQGSGGGMTGGLLGALAGALVGGSREAPVKGAVGGGTLAVLGSMALQAYRKMQADQPRAAGVQGDDGLDELIAGLRRPQNDEEQHKVQDMALLTLKAMINAAKADGRIDDEEMSRIVGKVREGGVTEEEQEFLLSEIRKPMQTDEIVRAVPSQQAAAQIYAASLLAIDVDTDEERRYLRELSSRLGLDTRMAGYLHDAAGVTA